MSLKIDDPRLTAFALGEPLTDGDRRVVTLLLGESAEAREIVSEVRALARDLQGAYDAERETVPASREIANIIEFSGPHAVHAKTPWTTHLLRIAAMIAVSAAIVAVGLMRWAGASRPASLTRTDPAHADWTTSDDESPPPDQAMLAPLPGDAGEKSSYAQVRRSLGAGRLPSRDAVRIAELVNHFSYRNITPASDAPMSVQVEVAAAPWQPQHRLIRIYAFARERRNVIPATAAQNLTVSVNFNPSLVAAYRAIGRDSPPDETPASRVLAAGSATTELFEVIPVGTPGDTMSGDGWQRPEQFLDENTKRGNLLSVTMDLRSEDGGAVAVEHRVLADDGRGFEAASEDFKFAAAVAAFGMMLRDTPERVAISPGQIAAWAEAGAAGGSVDSRTEFIEMVHQAGALLATRSGSS